MPDLATLTLDDVRTLCRQESAKYFKRLPSVTAFCYELFRRALVLRDERSWAALFEQYRGLVHHWVVAHPAFPRDEEVEPCIADIFARFWRALPPERFDGFPSVAALLAFLRRCVHGYLLDTFARPGPTVVPVDEHTPSPSERHSVDLEALWSALLARCQDDDERTIAYASFALDMDPREIAEAYPERFPDVADVHRIKRNLVSRWRRDSDIRAFDL